jgi:hypothetical protein
MLRHSWACWYETMGNSAYCPGRSIYRKRGLEPNAMSQASRYGFSVMTGPPLSVVVRAEAVPAPPRIFVAIGRQAEVPVQIDRQPRHYGREQILFLCPGACGRPRYDHFIVRGELQCRVCANLAYRARRVPHKREVAAPCRKAPPPLRWPSVRSASSAPLWVRRDYYAKWLAKLSAWEARALEGAGHAAS